MGITKPRASFSKDDKIESSNLAAGRYGTPEMVEIWGPEATFEYSLRAQGQAAKTLRDLHPDIISEVSANELSEKASLKFINSDRIREIEDETGHDIIAINRSLGEVVSQEAKTHINKAKTSADTTQPARALQLKDSLEVIAESTENLRDIVLEKAIEMIEIPFMDTSHLYDALPTVAGRPFVFYAEMLQSGLKFLKFTYENSLIGKWADATGNHHSASALNIDGLELQRKYCQDLGISFMDAPAQIPGLEFEADVFYSISRISETMNNLARYIAWGRSDDVNVFVNGSPKKQKGSSAMPHKDSKNGNPTTEEQVMSIANYLRGNLTTAMSNCEMPYSRNLAASSNSRINLEDGFKFLDHGIRRLANITYWLEIKEDRSLERVNRSYGAVTSQQVMTYLTDQRRTENPMSRDDAHNLTARLATQAWDSKIPFVNIVLQDKEVTSRLSEKTIREITDPERYIGESKKLVQILFDKYHGTKTF